jgi:hypothetical protein
MILNIIVHNDTPHKNILINVLRVDAQCRYAELCYTKCHEEKETNITTLSWRKLQLYQCNFSQNLHQNLTQYQKEYLIQRKSFVI